MNDDIFTTLTLVISTIPLWLIQITQAFVITMLVIQTIKHIEPSSWPPYKRRKVNLALSIIVGGASISIFYDQAMKEFVTVTFMLGNNLLYSGLAAMVEKKATDKNGIWTMLHAFFRPYLYHRSRRK